MVNWTALASDLLRESRAMSADERRIFERAELVARRTARVTTDRSGARTVGLVKDVSITGIGLVLGVELLAGQYIVVELESGQRAQLVLARVVHCRRLDEGMYRVGAEFYDELPIDSPSPEVPADWLAHLPPLA